MTSRPSLVVIRLVLLGAFVAAPCLPANAQVTTATILGTVRDASGGVIAGAEVTVTNLGTQFSRKVLTDAEGQFVLGLLPLGEYRVEATAPSFQTFAQTGIVLEVGRNARVDPLLELGTLTDAVAVVADAPLVETSTATLGRTVTHEEVQNLPLVNRNVYSLLSLTAGVDRAETTSTFGYPSQITIVNGSPDSGQGTVNYYLDGGSNTGGLRNTGNLVPNPDAVQEFRVLTNSYSAEYGRFGGGAVDVITKSGTNELHGSLFEFFRHDKLNAARWTPGASGLKDPLERHQFGATAGGPWRKDRVFFFGSYSGLRQDTSIFRNSAVVPTDLERAGNFSQSARKPVDPVTRQPFAGDIIPVAQFDPVARRILEEWIPRANLPNNFFEVQQPRPTDGDELQLKVDSTLSASQQLAVSYFFSRRDENMPFGGTTTANGLPWTDQAVSANQHNLNIAHNWILSPFSINTARFTYVRHFGSRVNTPPTSLGDLGSRFVLQGPASLPQIGVTGFFTLSSPIFGPTAGSDLYMARDVWSLSKGRHSLKLGGEVSYESMIHDTTLNNYGVFSFDGSKTGNALADFLLGVPRTMNQDAPIIKTDNVLFLSGFAQDDLRMNNRLTFNLGVRYDLQLPPTDPDDRKLTFVPGQQSQVVPAAPLGLLFPGDQRIGRGIVPVDANNLAPRVGVAWDPKGDGRMAVRAGFGMFYGSVSGNEWNQTADNQPFTVRQQFNDPGTLSDPYRNLPGGASPYPYVYDPASPRFLLPANIYGPSLDFVWPYTYQTNVSFQKELARSVSVNVAYVGAIGRKYPIAPDVNYPEFRSGSTAANVDARRPIQAGQLARVNLIQSIVGTDYHGLQVTAERRGRNFTAKAYYSFGKALEDADMGMTTVRGSGATAPAQNSTRLEAERARTDSDRTHNFVISTIWKPEYFADSGALLKALLHDWTISAITTFRSGTPFTVTTGQDNNLDGVNNDRPNLVGDPTLSSDRPRSDRIEQWFNTQAFVANAAGQDGNAARNLIVGPGVKNVDLALFRDFHVNHRYTVQFRFEATNFFNWVNLDNPGATLNAPATFGKIRTTRNLYPMREIQLGARLSF